MSNAPKTRHAATKALSGGTEVRVTPALEVEFAVAVAEYDRGDCTELTREQLDSAASTGEWPWPEDESRD